MEGENCPQLLDLIAKEREWLVQRDHEQRSHNSNRSSEDKKLELRLGLGPPGEDWANKDGSKSNFREKDQSLLSLGHFSNHNNTSGAKRGFNDTFEREPIKDCWVMNNNNGSGSQTGPNKFSSPENQNPKNPVGFSSSYHGKIQQSQYHQFTSSSAAPKSLSVMPKKESSSSSQHCCTKVVDLQCTEKKAFSPVTTSANTAVPNSPQKRAAPPPVVGWPPIRSFRKNLANTSSWKPPSHSENEVPNKFESEKQIESARKGLFVKINMDGVPIGRKVDLKAFDSYEKLSSAVDELFRDLLAAQGNSFTGGIQQKKQEGAKAITGLLDGSGEYTLVYEDNEGDRVLVGDVPWHMFVSTVKRLRVLKSSELSALGLGNSKQEKLPLDAALR